MDSGRPTHRRETPVHAPAAWTAFDPARWQAVHADRLEQPWRALPAHVKRSSIGRPWRGLVVWHQVGPQEDLYIPPAGVHCILLRRGTPTQLLQRQGDAMQETRWQPGEAVIVPAGVPTFWRSSAPRDNIHIDLAPAWLQRAGGAEVQLASCFGRKDPVLASFGQLLLASLDSNTSLQPEFGERVAQALALHLVENYAREAGAARATAGLAMKQVRLLTDAVIPRLHERWPVPRLAAVVGLSPFHFSRAFKASLGMTPHAWMSLQRMEVAARMVRGSGLSLVEIAVSVGYPSAAHFSQAFRRHWGLSPSAYRRA
jgi:AraC family transcriptional regulator